MHVTIKDVAKASGVSPSTVSRVIADSPKISDQTKGKVYEAMKALNYQPNIIARSLANKKSYTLGMILPAKEELLFDNPFFIRAMRGLSIYAKKHGYYIMYNYCRTEEEELDTIRSFISGKWVDGIILTTTRIEDKNVSYLFEIEHPFVVIGTPEIHRDEILYVDNDNVAAMEQVVTKLIEQGHRKIVFAGGEYEFSVNRRRLRGYRNAHEKMGIACDERLIMENGPTDEKAYNNMKEILKSIEPDAIVGVDDLIAYGAYKAYHDVTGQEIAVAAFNNTSLAAYHRPSFSSVDVMSEEMGRVAAELLIGRIEGNPLPDNKVIINTEYIERESTLNNILDRS